MADYTINDTLLSLPQYFDDVHLLGDKEFGVIYEIICGPLRKGAQDIVYAYLEKEDATVKSFIMDGVYSNDILKKDYREYFLTDATANQVGGDVVSNYVRWALGLHSQPICTLPYYGRNLESVKNDNMLEKLINIAEEVYVRGYSTATNAWISTEVVLRRLKERQYPPNLWA